MKMRKFLSLICAAALMTTAALPAAQAYALEADGAAAGDPVDDEEEYENHETADPPMDEPPTVVSGDYEYQVLADFQLDEGLEHLEGTAKITKYNGTDENVEIPAELDGKKVTWLGFASFAENEKLKSVTVPEGVEQVGHRVFEHCPNLESVKFPNTVKRFGSEVFADDTSLVDADIPDSVEEMGVGIFSGCTALKKVSLPDCMLSIFTFSGCTSLEEAAMGKSVDMVPHCVFENCTSLKEYTIPASVERVFQGCFRNCTSLEKVVFEGNTEILDGEEEGDYPVFDNCPKLTIYGHSGSPAEEYANEHDIPFVDLDATFTSGDYDYTLLPDGTARIIRYNGSEENVVVPAELDGKTVTEIGNTIEGERYHGAFAENTSIKTVTLPDTITLIDIQAFLGCQNLTQINLPDSITEIGGGAFAGTALTSITFPKLLAVIPNHGFSGCPLTEVIISEGVKRIDNDAFRNCDKLESITIPATVEEVKAGAFDGCTALRSATFLGSQTNIDEQAFSDREGNKLDVTIIGEEGSKAEKFANDNSFEYEVIGEQGGRLGDLDGDGEITAADALVMLRSSVGLEEFTPEQTALADIDHDGAVTANDALAVLRYSVGFDDGVL